MAKECEAISVSAMSSLSASSSPSSSRGAMSSFSFFPHNFSTCNQNDEEIHFNGPQHDFLASYRLPSRLSYGLLVGIDRYLSRKPKEIVTSIMILPKSMGNFNLRFYVKSVLVTLKPQKMLFLLIQYLRILNFWEFLTFSFMKFPKIQNSKPPKLVKWQPIAKLISRKIRAAVKLFFYTVQRHAILGKQL